VPKLPANYRLRVNLTRILGGSADLASPFAAGACGQQVSSAVPHHHPCRQSLSDHGHGNRSVPGFHVAFDRG